MSANVGDVNKNHQTLIEQSKVRSSNHQYALIWKVRCGDCENEYGVNSCDFHNRRCPHCQGGKPSVSISSGNY